MAKKKTFEISNSLAQALGETVSAAKTYSGALNIDVVPIRKIDLDPENPRDLALTFADVFDGLSQDDEQYERKAKEKESLQTMVKSIKEQGVLNPIIVYKFGEKYRLITGERRTLASILAGKDSIQARVIEGKPSPLTLGLLQWVENIEREDLTLWERLRNLEKITLAFSEEEKKTIDEISGIELSQIIGCSQQHATNYKSVLGASSKLKILIKNNQIKNLEKAALIARAPFEKQDELMDACLNGATLKTLKALAENKIETKKDKKQENRGRQATRVNFGATKNTQVAKIIIDTILESSRFQHIRGLLPAVEWENFSAVTDVFKLIVKEIEATETK